ncbi:hypothetical protein TSUD_144030 [Trifolium subterraneum]|uniref:Uncharacterized protein n=1 Tax=Trifolium subterraneum TaxID=3900 RepID=A0A2Z6N4M5_TRISU|nr:hypothetical protein TSUD_144030 [Trifolium subterraneum]
MGWDTSNLKASSYVEANAMMMMMQNNSAVIHLWSFSTSILFLVFRRSKSNDDGVTDTTVRH